MIKKYYKIFEIRREFYGTYNTTYLFESVFSPADQNSTKELCEQVIESMGVTNIQYAIVEVWEKEPK